MAASLLAMLVATTPVAAIPFNDPATGFRFDPPAPFVSMPIRSDRHDIAIGIASTTGTPRPGTGNQFLCELVHTPVAQYAGLTQAELNNKANDPAWIEQAAGALSHSYEVTSSASFVLHGAIGAELVGKPKSGGSGSAVFVSILDTPGGRTTLNCATPAEAIGSALDQFRLIRDSITPPNRPAQ